MTSARFVTLTLNPAIDETVELPSFEAGAVNLARSAVRHAGGKGINVAACLADWGAEVAAAGLLGEANDAPFRSLFEAKGIVDRCVRIPGETRTNIKLVDLQRGATTDINLPGLAPSEAAVTSATAALLAGVGPGNIAVLSGSLPMCVGAEVYALLTADLARLGVRAIVDTSGPALAAVLSGPVPPAAIKPNRHELSDLAGRYLPDAGALLDAAHALVARGIGLVVVSMGAEGALFVTPGMALRLHPPPVPVVSSVGAGDAMVAGIASALGDGLDLAALARRATAFSAAKLRQVGAQLPDRATVAAIAATLQPEILA